MSQEARNLGKLARLLAAEGRWTEALTHAQACYRLAPAGSALSVWALHLLACYSADSGHPRQARKYARLYLDRASRFPQLERFTPFVLHALGSAHYQQRRWAQSIHWFSRALVEFARTGNAAKMAVTSVNLARSLVRMGRPRDARMMLESRERFPADLAHLHDGALAAILAAEGQHEAAVALGRKALSVPNRRSCDFAEAAEVALVVAHSLRVVGAHSEASAYIVAATELCALQQWDAVVRLLLSERAGGGELSHESAASSRGSADLHHRGCFSTGVA